MKGSNILYIFTEFPGVEKRENGIKAKFKNTTDKNVLKPVKSNKILRFKKYKKSQIGKPKDTMTIIVKLQKDIIKGKS